MICDARRIIQFGLCIILAWLACCFYVEGGRLLADPDFFYMSHLASERAWSAVLMIAANIGSFGLIAANRPIRLLTVLVVSTTHGIIAGCLIIAQATTLSGVFVVIALMGYYLAYEFTREAVNARRDDRPHP